MGSTHNLNMKAGIEINGKDILDLHPEDVKAIIASDDTGIVKAIIESKLMDDDDGIAKPDNYAEHAGRPSLTELPYGRSENDGYPYLPGHSPNCSGPDAGYPGGCWCAWIKKETPESRKMWVGGPDIDDFDM